jgi:hypothetical protein
VISAARTTQPAEYLAVWISTSGVSANSPPCGSTKQTCSTWGSTRQCFAFSSSLPAGSGPPGVCGTEQRGRYWIGKRCHLMTEVCGLVVTLTAPQDPERLQNRAQRNNCRWGSRGRRFKSCRPDQRFRRSEAVSAFSGSGLFRFLGGSERGALWEPSCSQSRRCQSSPFCPSPDPVDVASGFRPYGAVVRGRQPRGEEATPGRVGCFVHRVA